MTRSEEDERAGVIEASSECGIVVDLGPQTESISTHSYRKTDTGFTRTPLNGRREPEGPVMVKAFPGNGFKTPWGSLRSLMVSLAVLATVAVAFTGFCNPSTLTLEVEVLTVKLGTVETVGAVETATVWATRATRGARRREENIKVRLQKAVGEAILVKPQDKTSPA